MSADVDAASHYLWDNWLCRFAGDGLLHRFSLAAPRHLERQARHFHATIHQWTSTDGETWHHRGPVIERGAAGTFDDGTIWSGSAVDLGDRLALYYTGVRLAGLVQTMAVAISTDGRRFTKLGPILEPAQAPALGYDLGDAEDGPPAFRDPYVFRHAQRWHLVFGARRRSAPGARAAIGHAEADEPLGPWTLRRALDVPGADLQRDCPSIVESGGELFCVASTKARLGPTEEVAGQAIRAWRAPSLAGPWTPAGVAGSDRVHGPEARLFAVTLREIDGRLVAVGYHTRSHPKPTTWSRILPVKITPEGLRFSSLELPRHERRPSG